MKKTPKMVAGSDRSRAATSAYEMSWAEFDRNAQALARRIRRAQEVQAVVGVVHGGVFVGGAISGALQAEFFPLRIGKRSRDAKSERVAQKLPSDLKGLSVLVVDDIASSGDSLKRAVALAKKAGAKKVSTAALVRRPGGFQPDYVGVTSAQFFVFPWDYPTVVQDARFGKGLGDPDQAGA